MSRLETLVLSSNQLSDINPMMEDMVNLRSVCLSVRLEHKCTLRMLALVESSGGGSRLADLMFVFTGAGLSISETTL